MGEHCADEAEGGRVDAHAHDGIAHDDSVHESHEPDPDGPYDYGYGDGHDDGQYDAGYDDGYEGGYNDGYDSYDDHGGHGSDQDYSS